MVLRSRYQTPTLKIFEKNIVLPCRIRLILSTHLDCTYLNPKSCVNLPWLEIDITPNET